MTHGMNPDRRVLFPYVKLQHILNWKNTKIRICWSDGEIKLVFDCLVLLRCIVDCVSVW